jgi:uncharacterized repeat protein (TIGR03803 family)
MKTTTLAACLIILTAAFMSSAAPRPPIYVKMYDFGGVNAIPGGGLTPGPCGTYFGITYGGAAADGTGSAFAISEAIRNSYALSDLYRWDISGSPANDGQHPYATLLRSLDGTTLWGTTQNGGSGAGVLLALNIAQAQSAQNNGAGYTIEHWFNSALEGGAPQAKLATTPVLTDPAIYFGTLYSDGPKGGGAVYAYDAGTSMLQMLHQWSNTGFTGGPDGANPLGQLVVTFNSPPPPAPHLATVSPRIVTNLDLSTITLFGITKSGGSNNLGTVYRVDGNGSNFMVLHHFSSSTSDGASPAGGMVLAGNVLYGTTSGGGANFDGTIFKINTNGSGFAIVTNFEYSTTGSSPQGDLILSGTTLYGTTYGGGTNGGGTVCSIDTRGTNFNVLHSFTSPVYNGSGGYTNVDGGWSVAGVALAGDDLVGTTPYGGTNGVGTAYRIILPGPPRLRLGLSTGECRVAWPSWASNYVLQQSFKLGSPNWTTNNQAVFDNGTNRSIMFSPTNKSMFFRLFSTNGP